MSIKKSKKNDSKTSNGTPIEGFNCKMQCEKTLSRENCTICDLNYLKSLQTTSPEDLELSFLERIQKEDVSLDNINNIFFMANQMKDVILDRKKNLIAEYEKKIIADKKSIENQDIPAETNPEEEKPVISIGGFINVTAKKLGYFYLCQNNANGLRLHKSELDNVIAFVKENFRDENGEIFSDRSLRDGIIEGMHMPPDKKFQK